jgi:hypothetical protein
VAGLFLVKFLEVKFNVHSPKGFRVIYININIYIYIYMCVCVCVCVYGPTDEGAGEERDFHRHSSAIRTHLKDVLSG